MLQCDTDDYIRKTLDEDADENLRNIMHGHVKMYVNLFVR